MNLSPHKNLVDGGPDFYNKFARDYDEYSSDVNWNAPVSVVAVWRKYNPDLVEQQKIFDAGCGTGLVGEELRASLPENASAKVELYGGDLSPEMISVAGSKNCSAYFDLRVVNLKEPLPYEDEFFDNIISSGTFLQGHCGPECLFNIMRVLKVKGYFIATIRSAYYSETKQEWEKTQRECNCKLIETVTVPYSDTAEGTVMVFQKVFADDAKPYIIDTL